MPQPNSTTKQLRQKDRSYRPGSSFKIFTLTKTINHKTTLTLFVNTQLDRHCQSQEVRLGASLVLSKTEEAPPTQHLEQQQTLKFNGRHQARSGTRRMDGTFSSAPRLIDSMEAPLPVLGIRLVFQSVTSSTAVLIQQLQLHSVRVLYSRLQF